MEPHPNPKVAIISAIILILVLGGAAYAFTHSGTTTPSTATPTASASPSPSPSATATATPTLSGIPTPLTSPTADPYTGWSTFSDTSMGLSFRYPKEWKATTANNLVTLSATGNLPFKVIYYATPADLETSSEAKTNATSLLDYFKMEIAKGASEGAVLSYEKATVGSYAAYKTEEPSIGGTDYYYIEHSGHIYKIMNPWGDTATSTKVFSSLVLK
jgi:hypothetical protein